jgi:nicotinamide phosphoribosyltransferase
MKFTSSTALGPAFQTALTNTDSYKLGHARMYQDSTTKVYNNFTPRSMSHFNVPEQYKADKKIVWFGLQGFLHELNQVWKDTFFDLDVDTVCEEFAELVAPFCGPNGFDVTRLRELHALGYLPLEIKALPEGVRVPIGVPLFTITNTVDTAFWLPNYLETWVSTELWKTMTSATMARVYRKIIDQYADLTGGSKEFVAFQGHDFSMRGMSGILDGAKSGAGHLLSFVGTDVLSAVHYINQLYHGKSTFVGCSVPASEHSVMSTETKEEELEVFRRLIKMYPSGVISLVSDTYDFFQVVTKFATILKDDILNRVPDSMGLAKVVFRPDSGDPVKIICGDTEAPVGSPEYKGAVECLADIFGTTTNDKGYKTLNQRVGLIYGDSITVDRCEAILMRLKDKGFASDNIVFGIGSYTYQYQTRDTMGFAVKATHRKTNDKGVPIFKDPKTDSGTKRSAKGLLCVQKSPITGEYVLLDQVTPEVEKTGELKTVYLNGNILVDDSFEVIRNRLIAHG